MHADMVRTGRDGPARALLASIIGPDRAARARRPARGPGAGNRPRPCTPAPLPSPRRPTVRREAPRSSAGSRATAMPRAFSTVSTFPASISIRPLVSASRLIERVSGSASGFVPSRAPIARATRSSARHAPRRHRCFDQRTVDLLRPPPRKRSARRLLAIPVVPAHVNGEPRPAHRRLPRHQHPELRKPALHVDAELAAPHVRRVVHLQHHVRQRVRVHVDGRPPKPHPVGMQVQHPRRPASASACAPTRPAAPDPPNRRTRSPSPRSDATRSAIRPRRRDGCSW